LQAENNMEYVIEAHDTDDMRSWLATIKYCMRTMVPNQDGRLVATSAILYNQGYDECKVGEKIGTLNRGRAYKLGEEQDTFDIFEVTY